MSDYTVKTEKKVVTSYEIELTLPVDMGKVTTKRLEDRMAKQVGESGLVPGHIMGEDEKVVAVLDYHGDQIWPRQRKKAAFEKGKIFSEDNMPDPLSED